MASVVGMTAAAMSEIRDGAIVSAEVVGDDLILTHYDSSTTNAGDVRGAAGTNGATGATGATGPVGPANLAGAPLAVTTAGSSITNSAVIPGLSRTNVPVVINHVYEIAPDFNVEWSSVDADAEWHFWVRLNGATLEKFDVLRPVTLGVSYQKVRGSIFWTAPATASTDDFDVYAERIDTGASFVPTGSSTLKRKLKIIDWGIPV